MSATSSTQKQVAFTVESITRDLTPQQDKPLWPLSSYGAAKGESNVISGQDESFEELRVKAAAALRSGSTAEYQQYESDKIAASNQVFGVALANPQQVFQRAHDLSGGGNKSTTSVSAFAPAANQGSAFGSAATTSAFGKPSGFGALGGTTTSAFGGTGTSAFGSATAAQPAFGKSAFGQPAQPAFGPSAFGQPQPQTTSVFGQPSQVTSAFGQTPAPSAPSAFGQPQVTSAFGQPTQPQSSLIKPATSGAFGSVSGGPISGGFGAFSGANASLTAAPATTSAFGEGGAGLAPAAPATGGGFGTSAFGAAAPSNPAFGQSAFSSGGAAPSAFGQTAPTSAFGASQPPQAASAFGGAQNTTSVFGSGGGGSGSVFGSNSTQSVFGQPQQPVSAFGATSAFGSSSTPSAFGKASAFGAPAPAPKQKTGPPDFQAAIASFKATPGEDKYDALLPPNYADLLPAAAREAFESAKFEWGKIPDLVPPPQFR
ncbi:hypothetical protein BD410DRAFT_50624 [Rickenella mellea]|uniref:Uncharacterized protein n=1 Tax=Rickenella mellea TaxID=50990 RepID=A0A4R5XGX0_9AGAM|nr:hypothetical protein BD410DRAFT_50624 [Rickenella mellea]